MRLPLSKWSAAKKAEEERAKELRAQWRQVFAWWPVKLLTGDWAWLEVVERRGGYIGDGPKLGYAEWEYRLVELCTCPPDCPQHGKPVEYRKG